MLRRWGGEGTMPFLYLWNEGRNKDFSQRNTSNTNRHKALKGPAGFQRFPGPWPLGLQDNEEAFGTQKLCLKSFPMTDIVHRVGCSPLCSGVPILMVVHFIHNIADNKIPNIWVNIGCSLHVTPVYHNTMRSWLLTQMTLRNVQRSVWILVCSFSM